MAKAEGAWGDGDKDGLPLRLQDQHSHGTLQLKQEMAQMKTQEQSKIKQSECVMMSSFVPLVDSGDYNEKGLVWEGFLQ